MEDLKFSQDDFNKFQDWINLNVSSITWEGRYKKEFDEFWRNFFIPSITLNRLQERFNYLKNFVKTGPLISWFNWLNEKIICFSFIHKNLNLREIAIQIDQRESVVALVLRDFYINFYPHLEDEINIMFQVSNATSKNIYITHEALIKELNISQTIDGTTDDEIMKSLEVTLYPEWMSIISDIKKTFYLKKFNFDKIKEAATFQKQLKFVQEIAILFILAGVLILGVRVGNKYYETYLSGKISLFEPNFFWLDKGLSYKDETKSDVEINLSSSEIDELEKIEAADDPLKDTSEQRFEEESEVTVTSIDEIPQNFDIAGYEQSSFEEVKKGGYRGLGFGTRKSYRVILNSVDIIGTKKEISRYLKVYGVEQVDNVIPGKEIPGGAYYNLYVPVDNLREFLAKVDSVEKTMIYESKARADSPKGMARVFIWVKSI